MKNKQKSLSAQAGREEIKEKPLMAYINARVTEINHKELTDMEYEIEKNRQVLNGIIAYLEYKFNE